MSRAPLAAALASLLALGCGDGAGLEPPAGDLTGLWTGTFVEGTVDPTRCDASIAQDGNRLSGTVTRHGYFGDRVGPLRGTISGDEVRGTVELHTDSCSTVLRLVGTADLAADPPTLALSYGARTTCAVGAPTDSTGTVTLTKKR